MKLIISNNAQGTQEWLNDRLGKATGSKASAIVSRGRSKGSDSIIRHKYKLQLALERITGVSQERDFSNKHMERGNGLEGRARQTYEVKHQECIEEVGFAYREGMEYGCSVDGFTLDRSGIIEVKCPIAAIHYDYIEKNEIPNDYQMQIIHNLLITEVEYCDFVSYNEELPEKLRLFVCRFIPAIEQLKAYKTELDKFLDEVAILTESIKSKSL
jgi:hypothetical protein